MRHFTLSVRHFAAASIAGHKNLEYSAKRVKSGMIGRSVLAFFAPVRAWREVSGLVLAFL
jgi:hypothetical protein